MDPVHGITAAPATAPKTAERVAQTCCDCPVGAMKAFGTRPMGHLAPADEVRL